MSSPFHREEEGVFIVRTLDRQLRRWAWEAAFMYRLDDLPQNVWRKIHMGGRWFFDQGDPIGARKFVWRQVSKRWQYLHDDEIAEFISINWGVQCTPFEDRIAA